MSRRFKPAASVVLIMQQLLAAKGGRPGSLFHVRPRAQDVNIETWDAGESGELWRDLCFACRQRYDMEMRVLFVRTNTLWDSNSYHSIPLRRLLFKLSFREFCLYIIVIPSTPPSSSRSWGELHGQTGRYVTNDPDGVSST